MEREIRKKDALFKLEVSDRTDWCAGWRTERYCRFLDGDWGWRRKAGAEGEVR